MAISELSSEERESLVIQVAALAFGQASERKMSEKLGISTRQVRNIKQSADYKMYLEQIAQSAVDVAIANFRQKLDQLEPLAYAALKKNLEEGKLEAVTVWGRMVGADKLAAGAEKQDSKLTIIMPGASAEHSQVIEVSNDTVENGSNQSGAI